MTEVEFLAWLSQWKEWGWMLARQSHHKYKRWASLEELHALVVEGFWQAQRLFDKRRGNQFSTYAWYWAKQNVQRGMAAVMGLKSHHMQDPAYETIKSRVLKTVSLNAEYAGEGERSLAGTIAGRPEDDNWQRWPPDFWERVKKALDPRYYQVIEMRYRQGLTLEEAGNALGITRERIRQLETKALAMIHRRVDFGDCQEELHQ